MADWYCKRCQIELDFDEVKKIVEDRERGKPTAYSYQCPRCGIMGDLTQDIPQTEETEDDT